MSTISRVAFAGATGNLGPAILKELVDAGFQVSVLTRKDSTSSSSLPSSLTVVPVDYDSIDSLTSALKDHDAVVSTLGATALSKQLLLIEASIKAGVKRFIPSEFGSNTLAEKTSRLPVYTDKIAVQNALKQAAASSSLTYTYVLNGAFLDWGLMVGFLLDLKNKKVTLYDNGERTFSTTTLPTIGKAVVGVLRHPAETANRPVYVQDTAITLKKLVAMAKKATGPDGWTEEVVPVDDIVAGAWAELKSPNPDPNKFVLPFIQATIFGEGYEAQHQKLDNELLGIKGLSDDEVQELVNKYAK
ncbi:hypothetical protein F5X96DRAFT_627598 [Biscogniauxia mediterranea]|nr:hypothetical protein F5X96DRAFT_627598 [Biscogniauxia mediterranea]